MKDRRYHQRVLVLHYSDTDLPKFDNNEDHAAWLQAVGRMVVYGMHSNDRDDVVELVTGGFGTNPTELDCHYWPKLPGAINYEIPYQDNVTYKVNKLVSELRDAMGDNARPFTIGAVLHGDGKWGFHS